MTPDSQSIRSGSKAALKASVTNYYVITGRILWCMKTAIVLLFVICVDIGGLSGTGIWRHRHVAGFESVYLNRFASKFFAG